MASLGPVPSSPSPATVWPAFGRDRAQGPRSQLIKAIFAILILVLSSYIGELWLIKSVTVAADGRSVQLVTMASTVDRALHEAGVKLGPGDEVTPRLGSRLYEGDRIVVDRAIAVSLKVDGERHTLYTVGGTVGSLLRRTGVHLGPLDEVSPALGHPLQAGDAIRVVRVEQEVFTRRVEIPFEVWRWAAPKLLEGKRRIRRSGSEGLKEETVRRTYRDGEPASQEVIETVRLEDPVSKIIDIGTRPLFYTLHTPDGVIRYTEKLSMRATAYYPGPKSTWPFTDGYTATGAIAGYGIAAVDPRVIPLGTSLYVPGYGPAEAEDVGSAIKGHEIDLCFETYEEAIRFGVQRVDVYILYEGP